MDTAEPSAANGDPTLSSAATSGRVVPLKSVVIGISMLIALIAAFGIGMAVDSFEPASIDGVTDEEAVADLNACARAWNKAVGPVVVDHRDPDVDKDQWVESAEVAYGEMVSAVAEMESIVDQIADARLQDLAAEVVANYDEKLFAFWELKLAVENGDRTAEASAQEDLDAAAEEGQRLAAELAAAMS